MDDSSSQLHSTTEPPDLQAVETNCNETHHSTTPASLAISPSSVPDVARTADSASSDDSTVAPNSPKSHDDLNKDDHNSDKAR